ncbi:hypothetical protein INR49_006395 [Caranx melampygus]|nr:hypothetical protein INR49_006395 [Caranx melampygus]
MQSLTVCLLLLLSSTVHAEVVTNFRTKCKEYFYRDLEPQVQSLRDYTHICQRFENQYHFATLYDTARRIPLYSAYKYSYEGGTCPREDYWFIEPQNWETDMSWEGDLEKEHGPVPMGDKQAIDSDYVGLDNYDRGHLNPNLHHEDPGCRATFTLTNAVPQNRDLNRGSWNKYEEKLKTILGNCKAAYVLVGAVPSKNNWVIKDNTKRVNIPDYLWHAYCCVDNKGEVKSGAAAVRNENTDVVQCSLNSLKGFFDKKKCGKFFYKRREPQVQRHNTDVRICQTLANQYHFATLYDTANRIPVYSAYTYEYRNGKCDREDYWLIEPQKWDKNMEWEGDLKYKHPGVKMGKKQALDSDYTGLKNYNRGHLNPNLHHEGDGCNATFTLTNMVPQNIQLNGGSWNDYETKLKNTFKGCKTAYVLVGAVPSKDKWVKKKNKNRVNIPDYLWHAYCCVDNKGKPYKSGAAAVRNENTTVVQCSIKSLKGFFEKAKSRIHQPFLNNCDGGTSIGNGDCASIVR